LDQSHELIVNALELGEDLAERDISAVLIDDRVHCVERSAGVQLFRDPEARTRLNAITHKYIRAEIQAEIARRRAAGTYGIVVVDVPLLLDKAPRNTYDVDAVVVVFADPDVQLARLIERENLSKEQAISRIMAQRPLAEKIPEADWVIDNSGTPDETRRQVEALWEKLTRTPP